MKSLSVKWRIISVFWERKLITVSLRVGGWASIYTILLCDAFSRRKVYMGHGEFASFIRKTKVNEF